MENKSVIDKYIKRMNDSLGLSNIKRNIEDNKIFFEYKEIEYRFIMPNYKDRTFLNNTKQAKYLELVGKVPCEEELIDKLEKSGKSIKKLKDQIGNLQIDKDKFQELLAREARPKSEDENKETIDTLINQIHTTTYKQVVLANQKAQLLSPCLEIQVKDVELEAVILRLFEKKIDEKWVKVYNAKEDLDEETDNELLNNAAEMARDLGVFSV